MRLVIFLPITIILFLSTAQAQNSPSGSVEFKPQKLKFKVVLDRCGSKKIKAVNNGATSIEDPMFEIEGTNEFRVDKTFQKCPNPLEPGQTCSVYIAFCPHRAGTSQANLIFSGSETDVSLTGRSRQTGR